MDGKLEQEIKDFFGAKTILVTGASGFVGRHIYETLKNLGLHVVGTQFSKGYPDLITCDLTDYAETEAVVEYADYVIMTATKTYGAGIMSSNPAALVHDNIVMNANVLEACYKEKVDKVLFISSSTVYQESEKPMSEFDLDLNLEPFPMYLGVAWVKRYTEKLCEFYETIGLKSVVVRATNIYGKYDKFDEGAHFIPSIIQRMLPNPEEVVVWGDGTPVKDFIFIDDFIRDILKVFIRYRRSIPVNVCSGNYLTIDEAVHIIADEMGYKGKIKYDPTKPNGIPVRKLLRVKFDNLFGKESYTPFNVGVKSVIEWMRGELCSHCRG